jgi:hypothetical protein
MALYKADVWLGSNSGRQTVEIHSSSYNGVSEQIRNIYHVEQKDIWNIREVRESDNNVSSSDDSEGTLTIIGLGALFVLFALFTPWFLMITFGSGSAWIATKLSGKTTDEILKENGRLYSFILILALSSGCFGFILGDKIQKDYNSDDVPAQIKQ